MRHFHPELAIARAQHLDVGPPGDQPLDQRQIGRVVFHAQQGVQGGTGRCGVKAFGKGSTGPMAKCCSSAASSSNQNRLPTPRAFDANRSTHQFHQPLAHHQADAGAFCEPASCPNRLKGWNNWSSLSGERPSPVSCTLMRMRSSATALQRRSTWPPTRLYLMALDSRFTSTCLTRVRSALTSHDPARAGK